jgi:cytochrome c biogenesis protein CcmG/thiol:disulfide interchange protein DsbE
MTKRRSWWIGGGVAVVALVIAGLALSQRGGDVQARDFQLPRLNGAGTVSLASVKGRPVVINFFASWCVPCRHEMPALQAVATRVKDRVAFLGVDHQDDRDGALELLADTGVQYPTGYDPDGKVATSYGLFGMPTTLFVGMDGRLLDKHTGELSAAQLEETISRLFGVT